MSGLTPKDIEEVLKIRMALETAAARSAATKLAGEYLTQPREINKQLDAALKRHDRIVLFEADSRSHNLILVVAASGRTRGIIEQFHASIHRNRFTSEYTSGRDGEFVGEQEKIIQA